jgi:tetratricopeptide (TPR) repeat protein
LYHRLFSTLLILFAAIFSAETMAADSTWEPLYIQYLKARDDGKPVEALTLLEKAIVAAEADDGKDSGWLPSMLMGIAELKAEVGAFQQATPYLLRALTIEERINGVNNKELDAVLMALAANYVDRKEFDQAGKYYARLLGIYEKHYGLNDVNLVTVLRPMASLQRAMGNGKNAEALVQRALDLYETPSGRGLAMISNELQNMAALLADRGEYKQAGQLYLRALIVVDRDLLESRKSKFGVSDGALNWAAACRERLIQLRTREGATYGLATLAKEASALRAEMTGPPGFLKAYWKQTAFDLNP